MSSSTTLNPSILLQDFQPRGWNRAGVEGEVTHGLGLGSLITIGCHAWDYIKPNLKATKFVS